MRNLDTNYLLRRLGKVTFNNPIKPNIPSVSEHFSFEKEDFLHQVNYKTIMQYQQNDKSLIEIAKLSKDYSFKNFHRKDKKNCLLCRKHTSMIPKSLEKQVVE